jgi:hypothetical protein
MKTTLALLALVTVGCGDADTTPEVVPIAPAATVAPVEAPAADAASAAYVCPMCDGVASDQPGDCPKCGMPLVKPEEAGAVDAAAYHAEHDDAGHEHAAHGADCPHAKAAAEAAEAAEAAGAE